MSDQEESQGQPAPPLKPPPAESDSPFTTPPLEEGEKGWNPFEEDPRSDD